jgi:beta-glucosidase
VNFLLGPGINIARSPISGRNFEYLSEDPFLNAAIAVPYIEGVQSQGVIATVKHFALNNQEYNRHNASSDVDERTMREIYLPGFEAAVTKAHVDAVMDSYNLVNGVHATENEWLNVKVLKHDWDFQGILMSDWDATYNGVASANHGLDLEMPSPKFMNARGLIPAVQSGQVKESTIDDKVLRLIRIELRYGFTRRPQFDPAESTYSVADRAIALQGALESITLLKNAGHLLPLDPTKIRTIAVIGPDAYPAVVGGGGSADAQAFDPVSILGGIANLLGPKVTILYSRGVPDIASVLRETHWKDKVKVEVFHSRDFSGKPQISNSSSIANWRPYQRSPEDADRTPQSIRYTAFFRTEKAGKYLLVASAPREETFRVKIDGRPVLIQTNSPDQAPTFKSLELDAGQTIRLVAEYVPHYRGESFALGLIYDPDRVAPERLAALADVAVVAVGFGPATEGEGHDRTFALPPGQDELIEKVIAANPRTIVTYSGGGSFDTHRWLAKVPVLLHTYYPGQEGGTAIADILFGKHNPEGKLPVTFDRSWEQNPSEPYYYPRLGADTSLQEIGADGTPVTYKIQHVQYGDKLMVGYRYWVTTGKQPLFPFGFGLSYTTFKFSNLQLPEKARTGLTVRVGFDVTNIGQMPGADVAQLYISDPSAKDSRPERELKGFQKVRLAPGQTKHLTLTLGARDFSYWDESAHHWTIDPGRFVVHVGDSSENTPLEAGLMLN